MQDSKRLLTNALFWVLTATLLIIVLVVDLALPKETLSAELATLTWNAPETLSFGTPAQSEDALREAVGKGDAVGFLFDEDGLTVVHPGFSEKSLNIYLLELMHGGLTPVETVSLDAQAKEIPFNLRLTPIFICFEALMVGFILGGALMLAEKTGRQPCARFGLLRLARRNTY